MECDDFWKVAYFQSRPVQVIKDDDPIKAQLGESRY